MSDCVIHVFVEYLLFYSCSLWDAANVYGVDVEGDLLTTGTPISCPPVIDMISNDPILRGVKVIKLVPLIYPH